MSRLEGTPAYMPPEQLRHLGAVLEYDGGDRGGTGEENGETEATAGAVTGTGGDAWALGCVASFCLNGRPLFMGSPQEVRQTHTPKGIQIHFNFNR